MTAASPRKEDNEQMFGIVDSHFRTADNVYQAAQFQQWNVSGSQHYQGGYMRTDRPNYYQKRQELSSVVSKL